MPKKSKAEPNPLVTTRMELAASDGLLARIHGVLHLKGMTTKERHIALAAWCSEQDELARQEPAF